MNYKIVLHYMPWEIDYLLLQMVQLKKSLYHIDLTKHKFVINVTLNLSSYIIDWDTSTLPKQFYIEKFNAIMSLFTEVTINTHIYEGCELFGHLNSQLNSYDEYTDFYITMCPDINFSETLLWNYVEATQLIQNKYFIITPQISKRWDSTWDVLVNDLYKDDNYEDYSKYVFDIRYNSKTKLKSQIKTLDKIPVFKFAGWFDLYNRNFWKDLIPVINTWSGYGPWDLYAIIISDICKKNNIDIQQYVLKNEIISDYTNRNNQLLSFDLTKYYKNNITLTNIDITKNQRILFENNLTHYIDTWILQHQYLFNH